MSKLLHALTIEMTPPLIALEEHYYSNAIFTSIGDGLTRTLKAMPRLTEQLLEVGDGRLAAMDSGNISLQVVSHAYTPGEKLSYRIQYREVDADIGRRRPQRTELSSRQR